MVHGAEETSWSVVRSMYLEQEAKHVAEDPLHQDQFRCPVVSALTEGLQRLFKHDDFKPGQLPSTLAAFHGRDVFVCMATAAGKSLCLFVVPRAIGDPAMGIIISPLIAVMDQQVCL